MQVKICENPQCNGRGIFVGPDGTPSSFFDQNTNSFNGNLIHVPSYMAGQYFQTRLILNARTPSVSPVVQKLDFKVQGL